jgi:hypothetical protein
LLSGEASVAEADSAGVAAFNEDAGEEGAPQVLAAESSAGDVSLTTRTASGFGPSAT